MGVIKFLVPRRDWVAADAVERAYMAGLDEIPWRTRAEWNATGLDVRRAESDSGNFFIPYAVQGHGELMLSTASLMERERPYHLDVELARGTLNRLLNQISVWKGMGMAIGPEVVAATAGAREHLSWAATRQEEEESTDRARAATRGALDAMTLLSSAFVEQALAARHHQAGKLSTLLGINLSGLSPSNPLAAQIASTFNTALVPLTWREIEINQGKPDFSLGDQQIDWCRTNGLKICSGPLLQIDKWSLPDWMYMWGEGDEESFRSCVAEHIEAVVSHFRGKVQLWQCAAGLNLNNEFEHGEEERLRLAVLTIETIRRVDPRSPVVLTIDQPWGSFMSREDYDLSPLHFADALVRAELGLSGVGLSINAGYAPEGTEPRDLIEFARQMDRWSTLGLPLLVTLCVPSASGPDPQAHRGIRALNYAEALSAETQRAWSEKLLGVLLAKQPVQGIIWNQLLDSQPHAFPHGGLIDAEGRAKPILGLLESLRRQHLV